MYDYVYKLRLIIYWKVSLGGFENFCVYVECK